MTSISFFIFFIPFLAILLLFVNLLLAPHNPYQEKDSAFECGFHSFLGQNRTQFSISFFIFGLLFLLFDLEILLVYPYSVSAYNIDIYGLAIMMVFFILLTLGFIFELGKNALSIESKQIYSFFEWWVLHNIPRSHSFFNLPIKSTTKVISILWCICIFLYYRSLTSIAKFSLELNPLLYILLLLPIGLLIHYIISLTMKRNHKPVLFIVWYLLGSIVVLTINYILNIKIDYLSSIMIPTIELIGYLNVMPVFLKPLVELLDSIYLFMNADGAPSGARSGGITDTNSFNSNSSDTYVSMNAEGEPSGSKSGLATGDSKSRSGSADFDRSAFNSWFDEHKDNFRGKHGIGFRDAQAKEDCNHFKNIPIDNELRSAIADELVKTNNELKMLSKGVRLYQADKIKLTNASDYYKSPMDILLTRIKDNEPHLFHKKANHTYVKGLSEGIVKSTNTIYGSSTITTNIGSNNRAYFIFGEGLPTDIPKHWRHHFFPISHPHHFAKWPYTNLTPDQKSDLVSWLEDRCKDAENRDNKIKDNKFTLADLDLEYGPKDVSIDCRINFLKHIHPDWFNQEKRELTLAKPLIDKIKED